MKKIIYVLGLLLILTGCSSIFTSLENENIGDLGDIVSTIDSSENNMYIDDDLKKVILEINSLREEYTDSSEEEEIIYDYSEDYGYEEDFLYIDIYGTGNVVVNIDNERFNNKKYFNDIIEILDKSIADGLKEHIKEMEDKEIEDNKVIFRKIGRVAVYAENAEEYMENKDNFVAIKINFSDLRDKEYSDLFNKVSDNKYFLDNMLKGDKLNMMDFSNINNSYYLSENDYLNVRYNMYLQDKEIEKINILMQGKNGLELREDDIDVFVNLMDALELKEEEKDLLLSEYKDIFIAKPSNKKKSFENYNLLINASKGNSYSENDRKLVYFSLERI